MRRWILLVTLPFMLDAAVAWALAGPAPAIPDRAAVVFFDWDTAELGPQTRRVVAAAGRMPGGARIELRSQRDGQAGVSYRRALFSQRVSGVVTELLRGGVASDRIAVRDSTIVVAKISSPF